MSRLYILIRNDLPSMNCGKAIAQASHAVSQFMSKFPKESKKWCSEANGFGTTVTMEGSIEDIQNFMANSIYHKGFCCGDIEDPTYPFYLQKEIIPYLDQQFKIEYAEPSPDSKYDTVPATRKEYTCSWFFVENDDYENLMMDLKEHMEYYKLKLYR